MKMNREHRVVALVSALPNRRRRARPCLWERLSYAAAGLTHERPKRSLLGERLSVKR